MSDPIKELLAAFKRDHAALGRGLHELTVALRGGDIISAKQLAAELDHDAGPHIAFEERFFYPKMRDLMSDQEVDRLYKEHGVGQSALRRIIAMPNAAWPDRKAVAELLCDVELMERHVAECGELFGAMGRIPAKDQSALLAELEALRTSAPLWTKLETGVQIR